MVGGGGGGGGRGRSERGRGEGGGECGKDCDIGRITSSLSSVPNVI